MKICVVQIEPVKGNIEKNIVNHERLIKEASIEGVEIIIFPELSLTGYEPQLAKELAIDKTDSRLDVFEKISEERQVIIGVGVPIRSSAGIFISMIIFQPGKSRQVYSKQYLHSDEEPFFTCEKNSSVLISNTNVALAICYELSVPAHSETAFKNGAEIYIASVAKTAAGIEKASETLASIARKYSMTVLLANCIGYCDNFLSAGKSAIWNSEGVLLDELDDENQGILIVDTNTNAVTKRVF